MSKTEADGLKKISTSFLRKHSYLVKDNWMSGGITWTSGWDGRKNNVSIQVSTSNGDNYLRIYYTQTHRDTGEKKDFDYKIPLTTTPCNYGGNRYWFVCPMYRSGVYCGKRIGVLYKNGDFFACRHCYNLTYESRNLSGTGRLIGNLTAPELDEARAKIKRTHYNGKMTRKYSKYLQREYRFWNSFEIGIGLLSKKLS